MDTRKGWVKRRRYIRCSIDNNPADALSSGSKVNTNIDVLGDYCNALNLIDALMLGKDTQQRPQLQPPVVKWDPVPEITLQSKTLLDQLVLQRPIPLLGKKGKGTVSR